MLLVFFLLITIVLSPSAAERPFRVLSDDSHPASERRVLSLCVRAQFLFLLATFDYGPWLIRKPLLVLLLLLLSPYSLLQKLAMDKANDNKVVLVLLFLLLQLLLLLFYLIHRGPTIRAPHVQSV